MIILVLTSIICIAIFLTASHKLVPWFIVEEQRHQITHYEKQIVEIQKANQVLPTALPSLTEDVPEFFQYTKTDPRVREQWWIDLWLDSWKRQVGSTYVPLEGMADYIEPKSEYAVQDSRITNSRPELVPIEEARHPKPLMLTNGVPHTEQVTKNAKALRSMTASEILLLTRVLQQGVEKMPEPKKATPKYGALDLDVFFPDEVATAQQVNKNFDYIMNRVKEETVLRKKLDPSGRLTDFQWKKLKSHLDAYADRKLAETLMPQTRLKASR